MCTFLHTSFLTIIRQFEFGLPHWVAPLMNPIYANEHMNWYPYHHNEICNKTVTNRQPGQIYSQGENGEACGMNNERILFLFSWH